jgi:hypothetical protein
MQSERMMVGGAYYASLFKRAAHIRRLGSRGFTQPQDVKIIRARTQANTSRRASLVLFWNMSKARCITAERDD